MIELSRQANGYPVSASLSTSTADALGSPAATLPGKLEIHLMPCTPTSPATDAGRPMMREEGRSGKRRKKESGLTVAPAPCSSYARRTTSITTVSSPDSARCTCAPGMTAKDGDASMCGAPVLERDMRGK
ncbi:hypothetical protein GCM10020001_062990 [Nonomuraea salmonea]